MLTSQKWTTIQISSSYRKMSLNCKMIISLIDWLKIFVSAFLGGFWPYKTVSIYPRNDIKQTKCILIKKMFCERCFICIIKTNILYKPWFNPLIFIKSNYLSSLNDHIALAKSVCVSILNEIMIWCFTKYCILFFIVMHY